MDLEFEDVEKQNLSLKDAMGFVNHLLSQYKNRGVGDANVYIHEYTKTEVNSMNVKIKIDFQVLGVLGNQINEFATFINERAISYSCQAMSIFDKRNYAGYSETEEKRAHILVALWHDSGYPIDTISKIMNIENKEIKETIKKVTGREIED